MATTNLGLPTIAGNMSADVVRDINTLAEAVDSKAGVAGGLATLGAGGKVPAEQIAIDTSGLATKVELTAHKADEVKHITAVERDRWNQTPIEIKTDTVDANAINKTGFYSVGSVFVGSPFVGSNGSNQGYIEHHSWLASNLYCLQIHTSVNGDFKRRYRNKDNGVWTAWRLLLDQRDYDQLFQSVSSGKNVTVRNAITGKGGIVTDTTGTGIPSFQDLANGINGINTNQYVIGMTSVSGGNPGDIPPGYSSPMRYYQVSGLNFTPVGFLILEHYGFGTFKLNYLLAKNMPYLQEGQIISGGFQPLVYPSLYSGGFKVWQNYGASSPPANGEAFIYIARKY